MPDQRSVMKEYRYLDEKRLAEGLTPAEQARLEKLRVLVGPESGAGSMKPGFDVNAAAAALRESLLPAGLRNRPPPPPPAAPEPAPELEPEPDPAATLQDALASEYAESPFAPLEAPAEQPQDALFDPSSLGSEPAPYDPNAQPYDPNAQPYDPSAQPYDPNAYPADAAYDPNAPQQAWDPNQPWDPNAAPQDAAAYPADAAYDPNAPQAWDPNQPWDPNAALAEAQPGEPGAYADAAYGAGEAQPQGWDPNQPWDPNAAPQDAAAYPAEAAAAPDAPQQAWDPNQPWDPSAPAAEGAAPAEAGGYADAAYGAGAPAPQAWDAPTEPVDAAAEEVTDLSAEELTEVEPIPGEAAAPEGGSFETADAGAPAGWDAEPAQPAPPAEPVFGEYDAAGGVEPFAPGTLGAEPPLDASAFGARVAEEAPPAAAAIPSLGEYDDTAGFAAEPFDVSSVPPDAPGLDAPPASELDAGWQPEAALDAGFELASGGSFGAGADAAAPEWAQSPAPPPWEGTPPLDLQAAPVEQVAEEESGYEISPAPASESFAPAHAGDLFGAPEGDLAADAEEGLAQGGAAPELDFSQPDFSGGAEPDAMEPQADLVAGTFALSAGTDAGTPEVVDLGGAPPLDLGEAPAAAEGYAPAWDATAPEAPLDLAAEPALPELPPPAEAPPIPELTPPPDETFLEASEVIEEAPPVEEEGEAAAPEAAPDLAAEAAASPDEAVALDAAAPADQAIPLAEPAPPADDAVSFGEAAPAPADDVTQFAEAAAAAVASESTDLSEVIQAPPAVVGEAPPPDDFALDVAEAPPAGPGAGAPSFDAATALAGVDAGAAQPPPAPEDFAAPTEEAFALGGEEPAALAPAADVDLSFDLAEEPAPAEEPQAVAGAEEPSPLEAALVAAPPEAAVAPPDEEIPTIDGADILEEIVEDGAAAAPPQSLDFEPLEPEPPAALPPVVVPPPAPAPVAVAPPAPAAPLAPPPPVVAPPPPAAALAPPPPPPAPVAAAAPSPADYRVAGSHRVVVHTIEGLVKRGVLEDPELDAPALALAPQPGAAQEAVPAEKVKAIFFMLSPGEKAPAAEGKRVRVTFRDGRQIAGFSPDYRDEGIGFFMIPADTKTNTGRIWVYRAAVRQVAVS